VPTAGGQSGGHAGATSADDDDIELAIHEVVLAQI